MKNKVNKQTKIANISCGDNDANDIINNFCDKIDELALRQENCHNETIKNLRREYPEIADDIEKAFSCLRQNIQFGTPNAAYIKSEIIRPLQRKYKK